MGVRADRGPSSGGIKEAKDDVLEPGPGGHLGDVRGWTRGGSGDDDSDDTSAGGARGVASLDERGSSGIGGGFVPEGGSIAPGGRWRAVDWSRDHKPDRPDELRRIRMSGGRVSPSGAGGVGWGQQPLVYNKTINTAALFRCCLARSLIDKPSSPPRQDAPVSG